MAIEETAEQKTGLPAKSTAAQSGAEHQSAPATRSTRAQTTQTIAERLESAPKQVQASYALLVAAAMEQRRKSGRSRPSGLNRFLPSTARPK